MKPQPYLFDDELQIWIRPDFAGIDYSDGAKAEDLIHTVIMNCQDNSAGSPELSRFIRDWPSEYHLSGTRHNLLRPFQFGSEHTILELGCGCGALTRYLGETGARVIAVEGSRRRASIAAARCRDLPNVTVYCDNLINFSAPPQFDFVTLIGVLEYAPAFIARDDPVSVCLEHARSMLNGQGRLVLAIENQLGLKYLNGCSEDHVGIPYFGINGLYRKPGPVTFGRHALTKILTAAGLPEQEFFFPFPDYKLPGVVLSKAALCAPGLNLADLMIHHGSRDYCGSVHRAFAEDLAWRSLIENRLLPDLANSFLVFAGPRDTPPSRPVWYAKLYSRGQRQRCYQIESTIGPDESGQTTVRKQRIFPSTQTSGDDWLRHTFADSAYLSGTLLVGLIHSAMAREDSLDTLADIFSPWIKFLLANSIHDTNGQVCLPGHFIDCIPSNMIRLSSGEWHYFDAEWTSTTPIPLAWPLIRGVIHALSDCLENQALQGLTYRQFISHIAAKNSVPLHGAEFILAAERESRLVGQCHDNRATIPDFDEFLDNPLFLTVRLAHTSSDYTQSLAWHQAELARVKKTVSWRVTAPLRVIWNLWLRIVGKCTGR